MENYVLVPFDDVNKYCIYALQHAKAISNNVTAFCVVANQNKARDIQERFSLLKTDIPLVLKWEKNIAQPMIDYINNELGSKTVTVLLPQFTGRWWQRFLYNHISIYLKKKLLKSKSATVIVLPITLSSIKI